MKQRTPHQTRIAVSLPIRYRLALEAVANEHYDGNISAVVRDLIDSNSVTKSKLLPSPVAA